VYNVESGIREKERESIGVMESLKAFTIIARSCFALFFSLSFSDRKQANMVKILRLRKQIDLKG
jgi:hypothetical protein